MIISGVPKGAPQGAYAHNGKCAELLDSDAMPDLHAPIEADGKGHTLFRVYLLSLNDGNPIENPEGTLVKISEKYVTMDESRISAETNPWTVSNGGTQVLVPIGGEEAVEEEEEVVEDE